MLWLEMTLATSVCLLTLFSLLTFQVSMLFIVIDGVSSQRFDWKFLWTSFLPNYILWFRHKGIKGVKCCYPVVLIFSKTPHSGGGSANPWIAWYRSPLLFLDNRLLFHYILFSNHHLVSIFVFSRSSVIFRGLLGPFVTLTLLFIVTLFLHLLQRIGFHS